MYSVWRVVLEDPWLAGEGGGGWGRGWGWGCRGGDIERIEPCATDRARDECSIHIHP